MATRKPATPAPKKAPAKAKPKAAVKDTPDKTPRKKAWNPRGYSWKDVKDDSFLPDGWEPKYAGVPMFAATPGVYRAIVQEVNRRRISGQSDVSIREDLDIDSSDFTSWIPPREAVYGTEGYAFTDVERKRVTKLATLGVNHGEIAKLLNISTSALEKSFRAELTLAMEDKNEEVVNALLTRIREGDTKAIIFWLKARAGWEDRVNTEINNTVVMPTYQIKLGGRELRDGKLIDAPIYDAEVIDG